MKKMILLVALLTMVAFVSGAMAQQKPAPAKPAGTVAAPAPAPAAAPEKPAKAEKFSGTVEKVDDAAKAVVVKGKKEEKSFVVDDKTKITKGGKDMPLADLKKGMQVSVEYKKDGDKMVAADIKVAVPKSAKKPEKKEKAAPAPAAPAPAAPAPAPAPKK